MLRRLVLAVLLALTLLGGPLATVRAGAQDTTTSTVERHLPRTDLEAEDRGGDDEGFGIAWMVGAGVACAALIVGGGLWMQRAQRRAAAKEG